MGVCRDDIEAGKALLRDFERETGQKLVFGKNLSQHLELIGITEGYITLDDMPMVDPHGESEFFIISDPPETKRKSGFIRFDHSLGRERISKAKRTRA